MDGYVSSILRSSFHDGNGIRTVVFLSGCNLHCYWCHNPETLSIKPRLLYDENQCKCCGACVLQCAKKLHAISKDGKHHFNRALCTGCGECVKACSFRALKMSTVLMSSQEVINEIKKDIPFYMQSDGGVTLSGGDPFVQCNFACEILKGCKALKINTIVQTALHTTKQKLDQLNLYVDTYYIDIKHADSGQLQKATGADLAVIQENIRYLDQLNKPMVIRIPVIPGFNDKDRFCQYLNIGRYP